MSKHLHAFHMHRKMLGAHNVNVNQIHRESFSRNDWIAQHVGAVVGTMWFCYGLAGTMVLWALLQQVLFPALRIPSFDGYPFAFLFFMLGGIMQSLLMPLLMVKQNLDGRHGELVAEQTYHAGMESASALKALQIIQADHGERLESIQGETQHQTKLLESLQADLMRQLRILERLQKKATGEA